MQWSTAAVFVLTSCIFSEPAAAKSWTIDGLVVATGDSSVTVAHRPVPGLMPAMTMPFRVADPRELSGLAPGMRIRFRFDGKLARRLVRVPPEESDMPAPQRVLRPGEAAPDFELTDHLGRRVRLKDLRGRVVALNFLYTRCPMPNVCPRLGAAFASAHRRFADEDLALLSVTIDPVHDTPQVLRRYAELWRARADSWRFLTGSADQVSSVGRSYGLVYWPEEGAVAHTARTYVIGRDGTIAAVVEGTSWRAGQLSDLIAHQVEAR